MKTVVAAIDGTDADREAIGMAGSIIKAGGLVAFPTETVYGLGGDGLNVKSAERIYAAKGRPSDNPLIIHIGRMQDLQVVAREIPSVALQLAGWFWPGPFTMIFKKTDCVPSNITGGLDTVAVRMPGHKTALELIRASGGFVAAPSANLSGRPSPTAAAHVIDDLYGRIDMILDGGESTIGLESTILDVTEEIPVILRTGAITDRMLTDHIDALEFDRTIYSPHGSTPPRAPGMKYRHYAPQGTLTVIEGAEDHVINYINDQVAKDRQAGKKTGVIGTDATVRYYIADSVKNVGCREDQISIAKQLYRILREFDEEKITVIYSEAFAKAGLGQAIMSRLLKAAGYHIITLQ